MFSTRHKKRLRNRLYTKAALLALAAAVVFAGMNVWDVFRKERTTNLKRVESERELKDLNERGRSLQQEIDRLSTERGLEEELREKFEVGREGEGLLVITEPDVPDGAPQTAQAESLWEKVKGLFDLRD